MAPQVDIFSVPSRPFPPELKLVRWEPQHSKFAVFTPKGYHIYSGITDPEEVSYVTSPFLIGSLRKDNEVILTNNAERAMEAARGVNTVNDDLSEAIVLENVSVLISEWVPFGSNQVVAMNERLGTGERCQGGLLTRKVDADTTSHSFECDTGMTMVKILDYHMTSYINLEAEVKYPEDVCTSLLECCTSGANCAVQDGIIQIENFGIHFSKVGTLVYGMHVDSIGARLSNDISVDMLCRLLSDIHEDSSVIVDSLLSHYQRKLLQMVGVYTCYVLRMSI